MIHGDKSRLAVGDVWHKAGDPSKRIIITYLPENTFRPGMVGFLPSWASPGSPSSWMAEERFRLEYARVKGK